nr:RNA-directed DNA polymerase, eukaryota, reverse transcriptase zinc-binding domain protein [Tanacetum cinerariifolium]
TDVGEPVAQKDQFQPNVKSVGSSTYTMESANNVDGQFSTGSMENIQKKKESGLGSKAKKNWIRELCNKNKVSFFSIQETKAENVSDMEIKSLWGNTNFDDIVSQSLGIQSNGFVGTKDKSKSKKENEYNDQEKEDNVYNTNNVNIVSLTINAAGTNEDNELLFDPNMPALEAVGIFDFLNKDEDDDIVADMNNMDTTIQVSPIPTTRIHKDHPLDQVI